jgi:uncharacterized membrane protein (UPF0127 family)
MPWLVRDGKVLATLEVATSVRDRTRGLLGRDAIDGAILLRPAKSVHTFRMRFPIDVAFCDRDLRVLKVTTLARNRATLPVRKAHAVIESEAGTMGRWGVRAGDQLDIRGLDDVDPGAITATGVSVGGGTDAVSVGDGAGVIDVREDRGDDAGPARGRSAPADAADGGGDGGRG